MRACKWGPRRENEPSHKCCDLVDKWIKLDKNQVPETCPDCGGLFVALAFKSKFDETYPIHWVCPRCLDRGNARLENELKVQRARHVQKILSLIPDWEARESSGASCKQALEAAADALRETESQGEDWDEIAKRQRHALIQLSKKQKALMKKRRKR